ncbi:MAG: hypothetical protein IPM75_08525 [Candidatus Competibacteraceae bacterium]|nr:hypothetical protein [Candidatus Competibacteraceae bacterium]
MKIRHLVFALSAVLAIAFMQPLVTFLGGLALLLGVGGWIYRDLPPASQNALEDRLLGWLRRARTGPFTPASEGRFPSYRPPAAVADPAVAVESPRRGRAKLPGRRAPAGDVITDPSDESGPARSGQPESPSV